MTFRHMWRQPVFAPEGEGGGSAGGADQTANAGGTGQNGGGQNNNGNNEPSYDNLWNPPSSDGGNNDGANAGGSNNQQTQQTQTQDTRTPQQILQEFTRNAVGELDLNAQQIETELREGSVDSLKNAIQAQAERVHSSVMLQMGQYVKQQVAAAVKDAVAQASGGVHANLAVQKMHERLDFTALPANAPVAQKVLEQLLSQGKSVDDAIEGVRGYYEQIVNSMGGTSQRRPGTGNFNNGSRNNSVNADILDEDVDWVKALSATQQ